MRTTRRAFLATTACAATMPSIGWTQAKDGLAANFATPPNSARPRVWWHWMNGNISQDGIGKDLAWMKRVGIGGVQCFDAARATPQVVAKRLPYMTPEWQQAFRFAVQNAHSLNLEFAVASSPGWSETGGPWVKPKDAMKKLVWSETIVAGGARVGQPLAQPPRTTGLFQDVRTLWEGGETSSVETDDYYADVAVLAYPVAAQSVLAAPQAVTASGMPIDAALLDANPATGIPQPRAQGTEPANVRYSYQDPQTVRSATIFVENLSPLTAASSLNARLEASDDGSAWRQISQAPLKGVPSTLSFAPVTARHFRLLLQSVQQPIDPSFTSMAPGVDPSGVVGGLTGGGAKSTRLVQFQLSPEAKVNGFETKAGFAIAEDYFVLDGAVGGDVPGVPLAQVIDLTARMTPDGRLDWTPPAGRWKILRLGCSLTGRKNHPASAEATGLEVDKYDAAAVGAYLKTYFDTFANAIGTTSLSRAGLNAIVNDSTEVGPSNWTPRMLELFQRQRGYDLKSWLPALTGEIMVSRAKSDAFLYDFRRTLGELHASEHYGTVARFAHERGITVYGESLESVRVTLGDDLDMRSYADIPMGALWTYSAQAGPRPGLLADLRGAASIAHLTGKSLVSSETLTSIGHPWAHSPSDLQPMIDTAFLHGVTRPNIHTSAHQPTDQAPGLTLGVFGQNFTRHESWAEMAGPWIDYIARNGYLLQQGRNVADVAYFYGEDKPLGTQATRAYFTDVPKRYAYDFVSAQAILNLLTVDKGDLVSRGGARYRLLYLSAATDHMTLALLRKLAALVEAGATILGNAPKFAIGLQSDEAQFAALVARLWKDGAVTQVGRGRVIAGKSIEDALTQIGVAPDVETPSRPDTVGFVHRKLAQGDLYFVSNRTNQAQKLDAHFRVSGMAPEYWFADTGTSEPASYRREGAYTIVPLNLRPNQSLFVVFRKPAAAASGQFARQAPQQVGEVTGPWRVAFQPGRGAPAGASFDKLASLSQNADAGIKYFSGIATYTTEFDLPAAPARGARLILDLGKIGDVGDVRVNGRPAGAAWKAPYQVDIAPFVRAGRNTLEIRVANLWVNRLIGDAQPGAQKIGVAGIPTFTARAPLRPAGLIGPVTLWR